MKRLTKRTKAGTANIDYDGCTFPNGKEDYIAKSARRQLAIERFADIEDILCDGTDEYDLDRLRVLCNQRMTMREEVSQRFSLTAKIPLERLRELIKAEREGRCVVLPCREGDTVYRIVEDLLECNAEDAADPFMPTTEIVKEPFHISNFYDFGLFMFLTREEAEAALRREQDG